MKHNKKRNTAFIYETLTKELTQSIVDKNHTRKMKVVKLLKEFFIRGAPLATELQLYGVLLETKNIQPKVAERLLQETKQAHGQLDENSIFDAQSQLIGAINKQLGQETWSNFISNFKTMASVNAIFNSRTSVKKKVLFEQDIVDRMSEKERLTEDDRLKPLDTLTYNSFIKKFNEKYGALLKEQKELLNHYVASFADDGFELRLYLNEELDRLKEVLSATALRDDQTLIAEKIEGVTHYLEGFRKREFAEEDLNKILKTQELVQEFGPND